MPALYLDTSAINKLILPEPESAALRAFLAGHGERVASMLARIEVARTLLRNPPEPPGPGLRAAAVLDQISLLALDAAVVAAAERLPPPALRTLEAIHLATALQVPHLAGLVTYDRRLAAAAAHHGLQVWSPGRDT